MTNKQLRDAQIISNDISNLEHTNVRLAKVLTNDINNYRISISIEGSNPHFSMSLGGQKFDFKNEIAPLLKSIYDKNLLEIQILQDKFKKL